MEARGVSARPATEARVRERLARLAPWVLGFALGAHLLTVAVWPSALTALLDLEVYRASGWAVLSGAPLYDGALFEGLKFTYPPFAAMLFVPIAVLPGGLAKLLFTGVNLVALGLVIRLCLRAVGYRLDHGPAAMLLLTGLLFWLEPVRSTIGIGQINLLLMLLLVWDLTRPAGSRFTGVGVGIAAGIKLVPGLFIVYFLVTRRFRAAAVASGAFAGTIGVGFLAAPEDSTRYWLDTFLATGRIGRPAEPGNQSLAGLLARLADPATHSTTLWLVAALLLGSVGLALAAWAHRTGHTLLGITVCGLTSCAVSPFAWNHHWVWFVPLLVLLAAITSPRRSAVAVPATLYLLLLDWPLSTEIAPTRNTPASGLINADWPTFLTHNLYLLAGIAAVGILLRFHKAQPVERDVTLLR